MIHTVFHTTCEFIIIFEYEIQKSNFFKLVPGQVNINFSIVLNEMGPGRTSWTGFFTRNPLVNVPVLGCFA